MRGLFFIFPLADSFALLGRIEGNGVRTVIVDEFNDAAVSGADPIEARPGFAALLDRIESNRVRTVIVEDASRFARELVTQELGILALIKRDVRVLIANGDDLTDSSDPSRIMMRQIAGSFAKYEKARLVAKLKAARVQVLSGAPWPSPPARPPALLGPKPLSTRTVRAYDNHQSGRSAPFIRQHRREIHFRGMGCFVGVNPGGGCASENFLKLPTRRRRRRDRPPER